MANSQLSVLQSAIPKSGIQSLDALDLEIETDSEARLFAWTLTHPSRAFSEIEPVFNSQSDFLEYLVSNFSGASISSKICKLAILKIGKEWNVWVDLHEEFSFEERKLDNLLMGALYRIILDRDLKRCVLCLSMTDLTIHHIIQKRRNLPRITPPFGRSVPTNLVTLCRKCHGHFDPMVLT